MSGSASELPTAQGVLSPNQRGGQTKRERTRAAIRTATAQLLRNTTYDNLRVADIAALAGIGTATFYQVMTHKAAAVGGLVWADLAPLVGTIQLELESGEPPERVLTRHLVRLGEYGFRHRKLAQAFCRAHAAEIEGLPRVARELASLIEVVNLAQQVIECGVRNGSLPEHYRTTGLPVFATKAALLAFAAGHPENWRSQIESLTQLLHLPSPEGA